jgi:hypothetical protein
MSGVSANNLVIREFRNYYLCFIVLVCADEAVEVVAGFLVAGFCADGQLASLQQWRVVVNVAQCSLSFFVLAVVLLNPQFRRVVSLRMVSGVYQRYQKWVKQRRAEPMEREVRPSFYDELLSTNRRTILLELTTLASLDHGYLIDLKDRSRACFLSSVLGCLALTCF